MLTAKLGQFFYLSLQRFNSFNNPVAVSASASIIVRRNLCDKTDEVVLKPINASVAKNLETHGPDFNFQPGHQHHQHGTSHGHSHGGVQKSYLLNGSRTVMGQRPSAPKTVMEQRDNRR